MTTERGAHADQVIAGRARLGITQRELAARVGVSTAAIGQLELGQTVLGEDATDRIAVALELDDAGRLALLETRLERAGDLTLRTARQGRRRDANARVDRLEGELDELRARLDRIEELLPLLDDAELEAEAGPDPSRA